MSRHSLVAIVVAGLIAVGPAVAMDLTDSITRQLRAQGYSKVTVSRTFLGRTRIVATGNRASREIIVNQRTGEILRDFSRLGNTPGQLLSPAQDGPAAANNADSGQSGDDSGGDGD